MRLLLALFLLLAACGGPTEEWNEPASEPVSVRAWVDRADVVPGKAFWYTVEVDQAADAVFELPDPGASIERLRILKVESPEPERVGDRLLIRQRLQLKAPLSGTYAIPGVEGTWRQGDAVGTAGTGPILIEAKRTGGEEEGAGDELRDLKPPAAPDPNRAPLIAGGLGLLVLLALIGVLVRLRRRTEHVPAPPPAWEVALDAVSRLESSGALTAADQGPAAYEVSAILRRYVEARYGVRAWRMTTSEVLRALPREIAGDVQLERAVREVLEASDRVKFAREPVTQAEMAGWLESIRTLVRRTKQVEDAA